jgi:hypothetical protein
MANKSKQYAKWLVKYSHDPDCADTEGPLAGIDHEAELKLMEESKSTLSATNRKLLLLVMEERNLKKVGITI